MSRCRYPLHVVIPAGAALLMLLSGCSSDPDATVVSASDLVHVHGLAEDPSGDGVLVATHTGLFAVEGESITRVTPRAHDLMGFTVAGPGDFLASGHPDLQDEDLLAPGLPPLLGLVESSDGEEWNSVSLLGETDFHSLEAKHDRIYGYDVTNMRFLISEDRETWETMSAVGMLDFSVDPTDPDVIVGTGMVQGSTARSEDGGATWSSLQSDQYSYVDWSDDGVLYGVTVAGQVGVSRDAGETWQLRGRAGGQPEAILATPDRVLVAVTDVGIVESLDGGATFATLVATRS